MIAHVAGVPVEELLPWVLPIGGFGLAGAVAWWRETVSRGRGSRPVRER